MTKQKKDLREEIFESNKEELMKAVNRLENLVEKEKYLKVRKDKNFLLRYLRSSEYDPDIAFQKMQQYYSLKRQNSQWYITNEPISTFKSELETHLCFILNDRDRFGKRIYINKLGMIDTSKTTVTRQSQLQDLFIEHILDEEETQKNGISVIIDLKNFSWTLLRWLTPTNVCTAVKKIESLPFKKIEFHVVNTSTLLNAAIKLIWPFLSAKTKENIHFHYEDWPSLHQTIDPKVLPQNYGGTNLDVNTEKLLRAFPWNEERLIENLRMGYAKQSDS